MTCLLDGIRTDLVAICGDIAQESALKESDVRSLSENSWPLGTTESSDP